MAGGDDARMLATRLSQYDQSGFFPRCRECQCILDKSSRRCGGSLYHKECFTCQECGTPLTEQTVEDIGHLLCRTHSTVVPHEYDRKTKEGLAQWIFTKYICSGSRCEVNIPDRLRNAVADAMQRGDYPADLFQAAQHEVRLLIIRDTLVRFVDEHKQQLAVLVHVKKERQTGFTSQRTLSSVVAHTKAYELFSRFLEQSQFTAALLFLRAHKLQIPSEDDRARTWLTAHSPLAAILDDRFTAACQDDDVDSALDSVAALCREVLRPQFSTFLLKCNDQLADAMMAPEEREKLRLDAATKLTLEQIMESEHSYELLMSFMRRELSMENGLFWRDVHLYHLLCAESLEHDDAELAELAVVSESSLAETTLAFTEQPPAKPLPTHERLFQESRRRQWVRETAVRKAREADIALAKKSSAPRIHPHRFGGRIFEQLHKHAAERSLSFEHCHTLAFDDDEPCTFSPKISSKSASLSRSNTPVVERLQHKAKEQEERKRQLLRQHDEEMEKELTFQPDLSLSRRGSTSSSRASSSRSFLQSVALHSMKREQGIQRLQQELREQEGRHSPSILPYSAGLRSHYAAHDRLYHEHTVRAAKLKATRERESEALFHPRTNDRRVDREGKAVGEALYEDAVKRQVRQQFVQSQADVSAQRQRNQPKANEYSLKLLRRRREQELCKLFHHFDEDKDGLLDYDEFAQALRELGLLTPVGFSGFAVAMTEEEEERVLEQFLQLLDPNSKGVIVKDTFLSWIGAILDGNVDESMQLDLTKKIPTGIKEHCKGLLANKMSHTPVKTPRYDWNEYHSFHPQTNRPNRGAITDQQRQERMEALFHQKNTFHEAAVARRQRVAQEMNDQLDSVCTFKPATNMRSPSPHRHISPSTRQVSPSNILGTHAHSTSQSPERHLIRPESAGWVRQRPEWGRSAASSPGRNSPLRFDVAPLADSPPQFPLQKHVRQSSEDRELASHCTFSPAINPLPRDRFPSGAPKGYEEAVNRLRQAFIDRELSKSPESNRAESPPATVPSLTKHRDKTCLLTVDVILGPDRVAHIAIYEGDNPRVLARNFAVANQLSDDMRVRLEDILLNHIRAIGVGIPGKATSLRHTQPQRPQEDQLNGSDQSSEESESTD